MLSVLCAGDERDRHTSSGVCPELLYPSQEPVGAGMSPDHVFMMRRRRESFQSHTVGGTAVDTVMK